MHPQTTIENYVKVAHSCGTVGTKSSPGRSVLCLHVPCPRIEACSDIPPTSSTTLWPYRRRAIRDDQREQPLGAPRKTRRKQILKNIK